jgi:hypothetical protein
MTEVASSNFANTLIDRSSRKNYNIYIPLYIPDSEDEAELMRRKEEGKVRRKETQTSEDVVTEDNIAYYDDGWEVKKNKNDVKLCFGENTWQYKMINDLYIFKDDGSSVLEVFDLMRMNRKFNKARNNYYRNKYMKKMMRTISDKSWDSIKDLVVEKYQM